MQDSKRFSFIRPRLIEIFRLNAESISLESLMNHFDIAPDHADNLADFLDFMVEDGLIKKEKMGLYKPVKAFSDILILKNSIDPSKQKSKKYHNFEIFGYPGSVVRVPIGLIKKFKVNSPLRPHETIAVLAERKKGTTLNARRILGGYTKGKRPTILGKFNACAEGEDPTMKSKELRTDIRLNVEFAADIPQDYTKPVPFIIPPDFDPLNPKVRFTGLKWYPETGRSIVSIIAEKYGLHHSYPRGAFQKATKAISRPIEFDGRENLTHEKILVIDPVDARDHDDGILIERTIDGYRTLVVVSDIPFYVRSGSTLDRVARERGFTHYFPDATFHMFPENLVKQASLYEGAQKPVIFFEQYYDLDGNKVGEPRIGAGVIKKQKQMSYDDFDIKIRNEPHHFSAYNELGTILVSQMREKRIVFDTDSRGNNQIFSQLLVSAMMIEANAAASEFLLSRDIPFPSRIHAGNDNPFVYHKFREKLEKWGYQLPPNMKDMTYGVLRGVLEDAVIRNDRERIEKTIRNDYLDLAIYSPMSQGHFGLRLSGYAHATSPIRRYPDIRVLRGIHTALGNRALGLSKEDLEDLTEVCKEANSLQAKQVLAAKDSEKFYAVLSLYNDEGHYLKVQLHKIDKYHVEIVIPARGGLRGHIPLDKLSDNWSVAKDGKSLIFNGKRNVAIGESIKIKILGVQPDKAQWSFDLVEPSKQAITTPRKAHNLGLLHRIS